MDDIKIAEYTIKADRNYMKTHEWIKKDGDTYTIGLSDYAQAMLKEISYVQYEDVGATFEQKEIILVVEALKASGDIYAPFDLEILENNEALEDEPEKVNESPYGDGWLSKFKTLNYDDSLLLSAEEYAKIVQEELEEL